MKITLESRVTVSPEVMMQEVGGEAVLLDLDSESYFGLDTVGTRIWRLIEQDGQLQTVHAALLDEYDVEPLRLEQDVCDLVSRLADAGLVKVATTHARES